MKQRTERKSLKGLNRIFLACFISINAYYKLPSSRAIWNVGKGGACVKTIAGATI